MMRVVRSFRIRIALLASFLASAVLLGYGWWAWITIDRVNTRRIDDQLARMAQPMLGPPGGHRDWGAIERNLEFLSGDNPAWRPVFLVKDRFGAILHQSLNWPNQLRPDKLPVPEPIPAPPPGQPNPDGMERPRFGPPDGPMGPEFRPPEHRGRQYRGQRFIDAIGPPPPPGMGAFLTHGERGESWRIGVFASRERTIAIGLNFAAFGERRLQVRNALIAAMVLGLLVVAGGGYAVAQRALRPVQTLGATAERITASGLDQRIPAEREDVEFQRVIQLFNGMLDRLQASFQQATRFSADAAHELKTPLAVLQGTLERGIQTTPPGSDEQGRYAALLEEVQRLKAIVQKLLLLSLADAGQLKIAAQPVCVASLVRRVAEDIEIIAPGITVETQYRDEGMVEGDPDLLLQVVQNLSTNAVRYNQPDGLVQFVVTSDSRHVRLSVTNTGPGIPIEEQSRIFDRFYRVDKARARDQGGAGLGLSLAREIVRAHRGELVLAGSHDGRTTFEMTLPAAHTAQS